MKKNRSFDEVFTRLRHLESRVKVSDKRDKSLAKLFVKHDKQEMKKYNKIDDSLRRLSNNQYIAVGILIAYEYFTKL